MRKFVQITLGTIAVAALTASTAFANTITVSPTPVITGAGPYTWTYAVSLEGNSQINNGDFFTIFDFAGFVPGTQNVVAGWVASSANTGVCPAQAPFPALCAVADDGLVPNLTWTRTGGVIIGPGANNPPALLSLFSAQSIYNAQRNDFYTSQDQDNNPGGTPAEGAGGNTNVPFNPVPEPTSMLLLGAGLVGLAARIRRRVRS